MILTKITLTIEDKQFDILHFNYHFCRDTDTKGRPCSRFYEGSIIIGMESLPENYLMSRLVSFEQMLVSGKIEVWAKGGEQCIRRIEFEKAYIYHHEEEMNSYQPLPMLTTISISPLRLDINKKVRIDRRISDTNNGCWEKYVPPKEEKSKQEKEEKKEQEEVKITVLIELPHSREEGIAAKGLGGHTGIAIGEKFFDYGPDYYVKRADEQVYGADINKDGDTNDIVTRTKVKGNNEQLYTYHFAPGRPWWGRNIAQLYNIDVNNIPLSKVLEYIAIDWHRTWISGTVYQIEFFVNKDNADKILQWWQERYNHLKIYSVWPTEGEQCTTAVKTALQIGGLHIPDITQRPKGLLNDLRKITSTSDKHKGDPVKVQIIKEESLDYYP